MPARVVVAPQAFKGSADAHEVADAIAEGLERVWPGGVVDRIGVADGGEGTVRALVEAKRGEYRDTVVRDPLGRRVAARWGVIDDRRTAVVEMAASSGLPLLAAGERDARRASSYGTGELIREAARSGARRLIVGVGGSATNDGGAGMLRALGLRFLDREGRDLDEGGATLARLATITGEVDAAIAHVDILVASDVRNPLCGPDGASAVFGPQKGASPEDVRTLDAALAHYADVVARRVGRDRRDEPGAGAAGGVGFALLAVLGARVRSGAELVLDACDFGARLAGATLCVTGEGRLDEQTALGKASGAVARRARAAGVPAAAIVGSLGPGYERAFELGFVAIEPIAVGPATLEELMTGWRPLVVAAAERLARALQGGRQMARV